MPSNSAIKFKTRIDDLAHLRSLAIDKRIKPIIEQQKQIYLHSYLTGVVAAWDAYIKSVVKEFQSLIALPTDIRYTAIYSLLNNFVLTNTDKLNTPNADNTRNFLIQTTGYDPIGDWIWSGRGFTAHSTRERLNEILKVRHSFAHGFSMPSYSWNRTPTGKVRLTTLSVDDARSLLIFLVKTCDGGLRNVLITVHSTTPTW